MNRIERIPGSVIVVAGVAGSGKTTVGRRLADAFGLRFVDGDDLHPPSNVDAMARGIPLTEAEREPWLVAVRDVLASGDVVVACSALRRRHRDLLRTARGVRFVYLDIDRPTARRRLGSRTGHFAGADLAESQFETLEQPQPDETDVVSIDGTRPVAEVVEMAKDAVTGSAGTPP